MTVPVFPSIAVYQHSSKDESQRFPVHNPATGEVITTVQGGDEATVDAAVAIAKKTFEEDWSYRAPAERAALLLKCADVLQGHLDELALMLSMENGKPVQDARMFDCNFLVGVLRFFGGLADKLPSQFYDRGATQAMVLREPHGVCVGILPFNWPPIHTGSKTAGCLAAGNVLILKPGEQAPLTSLRIVELMNTVLPPGVLQAIPGVGLSVPKAMATHKDVRMISLTGSPGAGMAVSALAAPTLKPVQLELGGKNCIIIFDDFDIDQAARWAIDAAYFNKGEACTAGSRIVVHASVHDKFVERMVAGVSKLRAGEGTDPKTHVGPVVSRAQQEKVLAWIETAKREGATVAAQGIPASGERFKNGYFVTPTLLTGVTPDMEVAREEIFGPVLTVCRFETEEEAIEIANGTAYGFVVSVMSRDFERTTRMTRRFHAGIVLVNNYYRNVLGLPFGGTKHTGTGRELSIDTLNEWTNAKVVQFPSGRGQPLKPWRAAADVFPEQ